MRRWFPIVLAFLYMSTVHANGLVVDSAGAREHAFSRAQWKHATHDMDYSREKEVEPPAESKSFSLPAPTPVVRYILFAGVLALLAWVLYRILPGSSYRRKNETVPGIQSETVLPEDNLLESDLDKPYADAVAAGNYRLAVRLQYLMLIRMLALQKRVVWKKEKTNNEYIAETSSQPFAPLFRQLTRWVEYAWYGEQAVSEDRFAEWQASFVPLLDELKNEPLPESR